MKSLYDDREAREFISRYADLPQALALRVYTSRLIGREPDLVLHGGGNTSVKTRGANILGEELDVLYVKGSGRDLATIEPSGFPGLDLAYLRKLRVLDRLSDEEMVNELRTHLLDASSPDPSVEALLHAFLPQAFIDHTHADSILVLTNQPDGEKVVREALGTRIALLPFIMPGFPLARAVIECLEEQPDVEAIVLLQHGLFTFGDDARTSYQRTIEYVDRAERYIAGRAGKRRAAAARPSTDASAGAGPRRGDASLAARVMPVLRGRLAHRGAEGGLRRFVLELRDAPDLVEATLGAGAERIAATGVLTSDHAIRTKNYPLLLPGVPDGDQALVRLVGETIDAYARRYDAYFAANVRAKGVERAKLDPFPRVILVPGLGVVAAGADRKAARIAADIAEHTVRAKLRAEALGGFVSLPESDVFDMEYWSLQQRKLGKKRPLPMAGEVALVTGAGGAIGLGVADRLLAAGALVYLTDVDAGRLEAVRDRLAAAHGGLNLETLVFDVTDEGAVKKAFEEVARRAGGLDLLVPNAGVAHVARLEELPLDEMRRAVEVNLLGTLTVVQAAARLFRRQGTGGNVVLVSSKNVFEPGASFGAYSASKAAAHQLARVAALELAELGVRVNLVNPDAVFGDEETPSGLWETVGPERMRARGLSPEELRAYYRERNLLKVEVRAEHVGNAVLFFATDQTPTTGAVLPVDGGLPGAFPR